MPRTSPAGIGRSRPRATTEAELVAGATRSSPSPSCRTAPRRSGSGSGSCRARSRPGGPGTRPRGSCPRNGRRLPARRPRPRPRRRPARRSVAGRSRSRRRAVRPGEDAGRGEPADPAADDGDHAAHRPRASPHDSTTRLGQGRAHPRLGVQRRRAGEGDACLRGDSARLDVEVVEDLEVVRGEAGRADHDGAHALAGQGPQPLEDVRAQPGLGRPPGALPADVPALEARRPRPRARRCAGAGRRRGRRPRRPGQAGCARSRAGEARRSSGPCSPSAPSDSSAAADPLGEEVDEHRVIVPVLDEAGGHAELAGPARSRGRRTRRRCPASSGARGPARRGGARPRPARPRRRLRCGGRSACSRACTRTARGSAGPAAAGSPPPARPCASRAGRSRRSPRSA